MPVRTQALLESLFRAAVAAAHPSHCLPSQLPEPPATGRLILLAAGKGGGSLIEVAEAHYLQHLPPERLNGIAVTRHGYGRPTRQIPVVEAGHPVPDAAGLGGAERMMALASAAGDDDLILVLLSGGASANLIAPAAGITLEEKQATTRALLRSGANIGEINSVRKHLSRIKGGRLARLAAPAHVITLAISDVPGDDPAVIGSGPTVPDPTTLADARAIVAKYKLDLPPAVTRALTDAKNESPKPDDPVFAHLDYHILARPADALKAAQACAKKAGYETVVLGDRLQGEAREVAAEHAKLARDYADQGRKIAILSGGELTVTLRGGGHGGPNQEYALALAYHLDGAKGISALAADTDGTDGGQGRPDDPAGAFLDDATVSRAKAAGLDPAAFLADNDSTGFFNRLGDLFIPGPTFTNVTDFRAIVVDRAAV
ncbi:MAG TPA: glycerate kinase [Xanthobacteraceae bacterium]|jgi:hydroxypyruvate reductase|nr:glycerate kinase [Xanthobacteraceae bacterium]